MKKLLAILLLVPALSLASVDVEKVYNESRDKWVMWSYACDLTELCDGSIRAPQVKYEKMDGTLQGYYKGGNTVYISRSLRSGLSRQSTILHEMIHYLHYQSKLLKIPAYYKVLGSIKALCLSEATAFSLTDKWLTDEGYPNRTRGPYWWKAYWHCEPYYNPNWDLWSWLLRRR